MLKKLWLHLFLPVVISCLLGPLIIVIMLGPKYLGCFGFVPIAGLCATSGFIVMYFTGSRGLWYKPLLSCPTTFFGAYSIIMDFVNSVDISSFGFEALGFCGLSWSISYFAGAIAFAIRYGQEREQAKHVFPVIQDRTIPGANPKSRADSDPPQR